MTRFATSACLHNSPILIAVVGIMMCAPVLAQPGSQHNNASSTAGVTQPSSTGNFKFHPAALYDPGGYLPYSVAVADVNGDGKLDIVTANTCASNSDCSTESIGVLLGNGDGTFRSPLSFVAGTGSYGEYASVAIADLNGDGRPDIAVTAWAGTVSVLLGNGDGTFQASVAYDSGGYGTRSVAVADVNGDGKPDLVVADLASCAACNGGFVAVLLGNGDGTFQPAVPYSVGIEEPTSVAIADTNGDGKPDIAVAVITECNSCGPTGVAIFLGNGNGTFQPTVTYPAGYVPVDVTVADVNADGYLDAVVADACFDSICKSGAIEVLPGNGNGTFQPASHYNSGGKFNPDTRQGNNSSTTVADVNADGIPDLIAVDSCFQVSCATGAVGILLGSGNGTFQTAQMFNVGAPDPSWVVAADLNGDGVPDLVVVSGDRGTTADGAVSVLLSYSPTTTSLASSLNPATYGQKVTFTATVTHNHGPLPTGLVSFTSGNSTIGAAPLNSSGVATLTRSALNADIYPVTAVYRGDSNNLSSTSPVVTQIVNQATSFATLSSSPNPSNVGQAVTFTAKITSPTARPTGPVTFSAGKTTLGIVNLSNGRATLTTSSLLAGSNTITVTFAGDSDVQGSSASVTQIVH